jgi:hypothetical protein
MLDLVRNKVFSKADMLYQHSAPARCTSKLLDVNAEILVDIYVYMILSEINCPMCTTRQENGGLSNGMQGCNRRLET